MSTPELAELLPEPASGRVFTCEIRPGIADAGGDRRVRLDAIARWLQDLAHADLLDAGFSDVSGVWVLRRMRIRVEAFPHWPETATLSTFCSGLKRFVAERRSTISGGGAAVEAVALWVWLDAETLRPKRFPPEFVELYGASAGGREASARLRHPDPPESCESRPWAFRATDVDVAAHVNNSHYLAALEHELAGEQVDAIDAEIEYRDPGQPGEGAVLSDGPRRWVTAADGTVLASIALGGR